jgi:hypothetical protein
MIFNVKTYLLLLERRIKVVGKPNCDERILRCEGAELNKDYICLKFLNLYISLIL